MNTFKTDLLIYGGTAAAVIAAVQARRMGKSVLMVSPDQLLGGMSASGLGFTDAGNTAAIGGLAREFYQRLYDYYQDPAHWRWERPEEYANQGQDNILCGQFTLQNLNNRSLTLDRL